MSDPRSSSEPPLDLAAAFALLREAPAGDVPGQSYADALNRAARKLHDQTKPYRSQPPRASHPAA